jgi:hypothetical protein
MEEDPAIASAALPMAPGAGGLDSGKPHQPGYHPSTRRGVATRDWTAAFSGRDSGSPRGEIGDVKYRTIGQDPKNRREVSVLSLRPPEVGEVHML